jgi:mono/diheme cytochrome c family protein
LYNTITYGLPGEDTFHPVYPPQQLRYQERWAVTHYVRSLIPDKQRRQMTDPPDVVEEARRRARLGYCKQPVRKDLQSTIGEFLEPKGEDQMQTAEKIYQAQCQTCHGETGKGDGPAGGGLQPAPRNFHATDNQWTNGTSPLAIYNTLLNGIQGTSMAAYPDLSKQERWALVHYVREWMPKSKRQETTEEDILKLCRSRSAPPPPDPISRSRAQQALLEDVSEQRDIQLRLYGDPQFADGADPENGRLVYEQNCASCHGKGLKGHKRGPYGYQPPFFRIRVRPLSWRHAGGTYRTFAQRSLGGVHASLPDAPNTAMLTDSEWKDLHAFVGTFNAPDRIEMSSASNAQNDIDSTDGTGTDNSNDSAAAAPSSNNQNAETNSQTSPTSGSATENE